MRWKGERESDQVEDRRRLGRPRGGLAIGAGGLLLVLLIALLTGTDPTQLLDVATRVEVGTGPRESGSVGSPDDEAGRFAAVVLGSTEDVWGEIFRANGQSYRPPRLRLYSGQTGAGACGMAPAR